MTKATFLRIAVMMALPILALSLTVAQTTEDLTNPPPGEWPTFNRTLDGLRFSPLDQITRDNVSELTLAWSRNLGYEGLVQSTPVVWDGVMYINGNMAALALDAATGDLIWEYRPEQVEGATGFFLNRMRGGVVVYDGKVFYARNDGILVALDAETGEEVWSNPLTDIQLAEGFSAGPIFADGKLIVGPSGSDAGGAPGKIHAVNAEDGELLWSFNIIPEPGDPAYETWQPTPPSWEAGVGGASAWNAGTYDPETRTVIYGTGQPTPWDRFDDRRGDEEGEVSQDLYSASFVALDVDTGELKWYHQVVPGDEWDFDQQTTPVVTDLGIDGETRRVALLQTTTGFIVLIDVETGEFLRAHNMMEAIWPEATPLVHEGYEEDGTPIINDDLRPEEGETISYCPGRLFQFALGSYSPETGLYYRSNSHDCLDQTMYPLPDDWEPGQPATNFERPRDLDKLDNLGAFSAINPVTGEVAWNFYYDYNPQYSGVVATAGNVVFAASPDRIFRAFDAETGDVLWQQVLTAHMESNPITYEVDGTQYVATLVGHPSGRGAMNGAQTVPGPAQVFVFSLPDEE